jgi:hypothetical protein
MQGVETVMTMPATSTYEAAELLLSWLLDSASTCAADVEKSLVLQLWLGNNVDLVHSRRCDV